MKSLYEQPGGPTIWARTIVRSRDRGVGSLTLPDLHNSALAVMSKMLVGAESRRLRNQTIHLPFA